MEVLDIPDAEVDASANSVWTIDPNARVKIRMDAEGIGSEKPITVHTHMAKTVKMSPKHPALAYKANPEDQKYVTINYIDYYRMAITAAKGFIKLGLDPKHSVGILGFNSVEWFLSELGSIFAGGFACGVYTTNTAETCQFIASNGRIQIFVVDTVVQMKKILSVRKQLPKLKAIIQWQGELPDTKDPTLMTWEQFMKVGEEQTNSAVEERLKAQVPNDCCCLIYTSGTTGNPKGVMLSHDNITWTAHLLLSAIGVKMNKDVLISYLPLSHIAAQLVDIFGVTSGGATIYFAQPDVLKGTLGQTLKEVRPTLFFGVPRVWEKIQEKMMSIGRSTKGFKKALVAWAKDVGRRGSMAKMVGQSVPWGWALASGLVFNKVRKNLGLDRCQIFVSAAAPITKDTLDYFMCLNIPVVEVYGMSESSGPQTISLSTKFRITSVGTTPPGIQTKLHNVAADGTGEVCMSGRNVFMGYLQEKEKTTEAIDKDGWLHSGDLGKIDENGFLYITGRIKELLITAGGENVAPVAAEDKVKENLPCVSNCMLIGDKRKFLSILLTIKCEVDGEDPTDKLSDLTLHWLQSNVQLADEMTTVTEFRKMCADRSSPLAKAMQGGIDAANTHAVSHACHIQKWTILPKDFSVNGGELGPTLKLRRPIVQKMYASTIEAFYEEKS